MTQRDLIILGTGGNALDILDIVDACNAASPTWCVSGFLDDMRPAGDTFCGYPVLGRVGEAEKHRGPLFVNAIGSDESYRQRARINHSTGLNDEQFATLVHPLASVSRRANVGAGTFVGPNACIGSGVHLGRHVIVCAGAIVGHDSVIGDYSILAPGSVISGFAHIGPSCYIGACSMIRSRVKLAEGMLVGMGAVVVHPVVEASVLVGFPARVMQREVPSSQ